MALCPGLIDTDASRPWFEDISAAQSPGAGRVVAGRARARPRLDPAFYGELVQFGKAAWKTGVPVAHSATT